MSIEIERAFWLLVVSCACLALFQATLRLRVKRLEEWAGRLENRLDSAASETLTEGEMKESVETKMKRI